MANCRQCSAPITEKASFCEACGAPITMREIKDPLIGRTLLNQYVIREKLGEGGFGSVYLADQPSMGRKVAVKTLHRHLTHNQTIVTRFRREGIAASRLLHASSVKMLNFGETEDSILWMAMEYLEGRTLDRVLREDGPMSPEFFVEMMGPICEVLAEAHEKGIIHRDLKPENIMLLPYPGGKIVPKVLDFGIAGLLDSEDQATKTGMIAGTPQYMSPEQWQGLKHVDFRSDIYSLGVISYQALSTKLPFEADTTTGWMAKHCAEEPLDFNQTAPSYDIPLPLQRVVLRALAKDPLARHDSTLALKKAFEEALLDDLETTVSDDEPIIATQENREPKESEIETQAHLLKNHEKTLPIKNNRNKVPARSKWPIWVGAVLFLGALSAAVIFLPPLFSKAKEPQQPSPTTSNVSLPVASSQSLPKHTPDTIAVTEPPPVAPKEIEAPGDMIFLMGGVFEMGSNRKEDQNPKNQVKVDPFFLDRTEVSVAAYQECIDQKRCSPFREKQNALSYPVVDVTFKDAQQYCAWRAAKDGVSTRLPNEIEWEFAARDGKDQLYPWGKDWNPDAAFSSYRKTPKTKPLSSPYPVNETPKESDKAKPINLIGNIAEWVDGSVSESVDPSCRQDSCRIIRGGSYENSDPTQLSATYRNWDQRDQHYHSRGFRCASDAKKGIF